MRFTPTSFNRLRLTSRGKLKPCLSFADYVDVKEIFRNFSENDRQKYLENAVKKAIEIKPREHCFEEIEKISETKKMFEIGG